MVILREKQWLEEIAIQPVFSDGELLFKAAIKSPDPMLWI
jgi:hypothetical protein